MKLIGHNPCNPSNLVALTREYGSMMKSVCYRAIWKTLRSRESTEETDKCKKGMDQLGAMGKKMVHILCSIYLAYLDISNKFAKV